jgi:hypothetical protein
MSAAIKSLHTIKVARKVEVKKVAAVEKLKPLSLKKRKNMRKIIMKKLTSN